MNIEDAIVEIIASALPDNAVRPRAKEILALELKPGLTIGDVLERYENIPYCDRFRWFNIDASEYQCDFDLMRTHCPMLKPLVSEGGAYGCG